MTIRRKLLLILILISSLPLLVVGGLNFSYTRVMLEEQMLNSLNAIVAYKEGEIHLYLAEMKTRVTDFSSDGFIRDSLERIVTQGDASNVDALNRHLIDNKMSLEPRIIQIDIVDENARVVASTDTKVLGSRLDGVLKGAENVTLSDVEFKGDGSSVLYVSAPILSRDQPGRKLGTLVVHYQASMLKDLISGNWVSQFIQMPDIHSVARSVMIYLVNDSYINIGDPLKSDASFAGSPFNSYPAEECIIGNREVQGIWLNHRAIPVVGATGCLNIDGHRWAVIAEWEKDEALSLITDTGYFILLVSMAMLVLVVLLSGYITRLISKPINKLKLGLKVIAEGDLNHKLAMDRQDEIGEFSHAIDHMVRAIKQSRDELQTKNRELEFSYQEIQYQKSSLDEHAIVAEADTHGIISYVNEKFCEVSKYQKEELIGKKYSQLRAHNQSDHIFVDLWRTVTSGKSWHGDICCKRKDGELYWVNTSIIPHFDRRGNPDRFVAIHTDITEQKQFEEHLRRANRALTSLYDLQNLRRASNSIEELLNGVCRVLVENAGYRLAWVGRANNDSGRTICPIAQAGYEEGYLETIKVSWGNNALGFGPAGESVRLDMPSIVRDVHSDERFIPWRMQAEQRGYASIIGLPLQLDEDTKGTLVIYAAEPYSFDDEEIKLLTRLTDDIAYVINTLRTEMARKAAESSLIQSEMNLKQAQQVAHLGSWEWIIGEETQIWSDEMFRILGYAPDDVAPSMKFFMDRIHPDDIARIKEGISSVIEARSPCVTEFKIVHLDNSEYIVNCHVIPYLDDNGNVVRLFGAALDVTEQRQSEIERESLQKQLYQSQRLHSIGQLTSGIAHDFNNILAAVLGYASLASINLKKTSNPELAGYVDEILKAGKWAQDLVKQLMTFSRKQGSGNVEMLNSGDVVRDAVKMMQSTISSSITLTLKVANDLAFIHIDQLQLHQLLTNLIINARDAIDNKGEIDVGVKQTSLSNCLCGSCQMKFSGEFVEITVADTGAGISEEILLHIFDPFFTTKEVGKGTGMGLSMVHGLVHSNQGHLMVESKPGQGCRFRLFFPVMASASADNNEVLSQQQHDERLHGQGSILVVDDEKSVANYIGALLRQYGYQPTIAMDSTQALNLFMENPEGVDLVITDKTMPGLTGPELVEKLHHIRADLPVIMCSGLADQISAGESKAMGIHCVIGKPIDTLIMLDTIKKLLSAIKNIESKFNNMTE